MMATARDFAFASQYCSDFMQDVPPTSPLSSDRGSGFAAASQGGLDLGREIAPASRRGQDVTAEA